ncbi:hypothetical protein DFH06DRAFT_1214864 [Mycena polygramma]|nr:hypothetical protein DFH06DRAFT_1214864 [Mycena polygramma]
MMTHQHARQKASTIVYSEGAADSERHIGAFFPRAQNFVLSGGTFTTVTNINHISRPTPAFRPVLLEDIDLRREICQTDSSNVYHRPGGQNCVKRVYSARVTGRTDSQMTVILYKGGDAEEDWRRDIFKYSRFRHPNFMQLYGATSSYGLCAAVFHDELIPLNHFVEFSLRPSPLWTLYICACASQGMNDIWQATRACVPCSKQPLGLSCETWLRSSTGRFCLDFSIMFHNGEEDSIDYLKLLDNVPGSNPWGTACFFEPQPESMFLASLSLGDCHWVCGEYLAVKHTFPISAPDHLVRLGSVINYGSVDAPFEEVAEMTSPDISHFLNENVKGTVLESGWTRIPVCDVADMDISFANNSYIPWITQGNHIFDRLQIKSHHEKHILLEWVHYSFRFSSIAQTSPSPGYLFLCPPNDLQIGSTASFRCPMCPAYWSRDLFGHERLAAAEAQHLGFPVLSFSMEVTGRSWEHSVYAGLRQFYRAKGFDPDSQDVAQHFGYPSYELSRNNGIPFAYLDDENAVERYTYESQPTGETGALCDEAGTSET